jgi:hypothetical protein
MGWCDLYHLQSECHQDRGLQTDGGTPRDNQANISTMGPELLSAFEKTENGVRVHGVGGAQFYAD